MSVEVKEAEIPNWLRLHHQLRERFLILAERETEDLKKILAERREKLKFLREFLKFKQPPLRRRQQMPECE